MSASFAALHRRFRQTIKIAAVDAFPLRVSSVGNAGPDMSLAAMPARPGLLARITDADGCCGWGEIWANFPPRANIHKSHLLEDVIAPRLRSFSFMQPQEVEAHLRKSLSTYFLHIGQSWVFEHLLAGLDVAAWDIALRKARRSFAEHMALPETAAVYASSLNARDLERMLPLHAGWGQTRFKIKLGFGEQTDIALVARAAALCPPSIRIMIDGNQAWNVAEAKHILRKLEQFTPLFVEEPIRADASLNDWRTLTRALSIPLAAGENIYGLDNYLRMANAGIRILQPDVAKWGGVSGALRLVRALPPDVFLWPHFMGGAVGQMAALSVTAAAKTLRRRSDAKILGGSECAVAVCEMDVNDNRLRTDLCGDIFVVRDGQVALTGEPGLVVPPLPSCLEEFRA